MRGETLKKTLKTNNQTKKIDLHTIMTELFRNKWQKGVILFKKLSLYIARKPCHIPKEPRIRVSPSNCIEYKVRTNTLHLTFLKLLQPQTLQKATPMLHSVKTNFKFKKELTTESNSEKNAFRIINLNQLNLWKDL